LPHRPDKTFRAIAKPVRDSPAMGVANAKAGGWQADLAMMPVTMGR